MKVLCVLALLTTADGNYKSDFSEIVSEIFGAWNDTNVATTTEELLRSPTAISTSTSVYNISDFATLRKQIMQDSRPWMNTRLRITATSSTANLCDYTKDFLQKLYGDWTLTKFYARVLPHDLQPLNNCINIRVAQSKGICKCHGNQLSVFNIALTCKNPKIRYIKDVAVAFVSHFKDAINFGNQRCRCKRPIVTGRVLSDNYIMLYDNLANETDINYFVVLARNVSALWELEKLEESTPELVHRKQEILCSGVVVYTTLKSVGPVNKINFRRPTSLKLGFGLSSLSFFDYLNTIPREEFVEIAYSSGVPI